MIWKPSWYGLIEISTVRFFTIALNRNTRNGNVHDKLAVAVLPQKNCEITSEQNIMTAWKLL